VWSGLLLLCYHFVKKLLKWQLYPYSTVDSGMLVACANDVTVMSTSIPRLILGSAVKLVFYFYTLTIPIDLNVGVGVNRGLGQVIINIGGPAKLRANLQLPRFKNVDLQLPSSLTTQQKPLQNSVEII